MAVRIKWYGHAAFRITSDGGPTLIVDPYTPDLLGYAPIRDHADVVVISSATDEAHCRADLIGGNPVVVNALDVARDGGRRTAHGLEFLAEEASEWDGRSDREADANAMYRWAMNGIAFAHMGDVGNPLSERQTDFLAGVDVLFALAGGYLTIALPDLITAIERTAPKLVIPMHFRTLTYKPRNTMWIEALLSHFDDENIDFACAHEIDLERASLPSRTRVLVMDYAR